MAAGSLFVLALLLASNKLPLGFVRFVTGASAGLALAAALLSSSPARTRWSWLSLAALALLWYVGSRRHSSAARLAAVAASIGAIVVPIVAGALTASGAPRWLQACGSSSSALLLGAVTVTMILGHWYLVDTTLEIAPLRDGALWFAAALTARFAVVTAALLLGGWETLRVSRLADFVFSTNGLFFLFRALMGLGAPILLAAFIWQTVKIRSTQSATGLLYVALILVLFGELTSEFLRLRTGYPL
jgi:hypothetical protein